MSLTKEGLTMSEKDFRRLRNKAISLGYINPRDCGIAAAKKLREVIVALALAELASAE